MLDKKFTCILGVDKEWEKKKTVLHDWDKPHSKETLQQENQRTLWKLCDSLA